MSPPPHCWGKGPCCTGWDPGPSAGPEERVVYKPHALTAGRRALCAHTVTCGPLSRWPMAVNPQSLCRGQAL